MRKRVGDQRLDRIIELISCLAVEEISNSYHRPRPSIDMRFVILTLFITSGIGDTHYSTLVSAVRFFITSVSPRLVPIGEMMCCC